MPSPSGFLEVLNPSTDHSGQKQANAVTKAMAAAANVPMRHHKPIGAKIPTMTRAIPTMILKALSMPPPFVFLPPPFKV